MTIQKILPIGITYANCLNKLNNCAQETISVNKKIDLKDFVYIKPYNISFKSAQEHAFETSLKENFRLTPDKFQIQAAQSLFNGNDTLVSAPTGTGKTLIAEYEINKNLKNGKKTIYTTPLKALSNEKYADFCKLFGADNVGLMTGDIKINRDAPVVIMTTEIYRNMLMCDSKQELEDRLANTATVIYDEFHYMNDPERGEVWETSIMQTPGKLKQLLLSATAQNSEVVSKWLNRLLSEKESPRSASIVNISPEERHVPLKYFIFDPSKSKTSITPLALEKYSRKKLAQKFADGENNSLTEKQKEILSEISKKSGGNGNIEQGLNTLKNIVPDEKCGLDKLESALISKLGFEKLEAKRAAAILADKSLTEFNKCLRYTITAKDVKKSQFSNSVVKIASKDKINELLINPELLTSKKRKAFEQLYRLYTNETDVKGGIKTAGEILGNTDLPIKEFEARLSQARLKKDYIEIISKALAVEKQNPRQSVVYDLVNVLEKENKLPAIFFTFSKRKCDALKNEFLKSGKTLLTPEEQAEAAKIVQKYIDKGVYLGANDEMSDFLSGVAVHHAGKMPWYKSLIEELSQNKLVKVVFATSTLGAGINVPARTVVFTQLDKYNGSASVDGEKFADLTSNEFHQMAGRAGRRGKDPVGNVVIIPDKKHSPMSIFKLVQSPPDPVNSNFKPSYSFLSHLIAVNKTPEHTEDILERSFIKESLESLGKDSEKILKEIKNEFVKKSKVLTDKQLGLFEEFDGLYYPAIKGAVVSQARGIDGLLFTDVLFESALEYLTPEELAQIACALTPYNDKDEDSLPTIIHDESVSDTLYAIGKANAKTREIEQQYKVFSKPVKFNTVDVPFMAQWVKSSKEDSIALWEKIITSAKDEKSQLSEGEFLRVINSTVDILEQIKNAAKFAETEAKTNGDSVLQNRMKTISQTAAKSLSLIQKEPVVFSL